MSEQRAPYYSDSGEQLSPTPVLAETTLQAIKDAIADGERAGRPASNILEMINALLKGREGKQHD